MKGSNVYVEKGTELYVNGTIYNDSLINIVGNTVKGIIWNRDSIHVAGNINNGANTLTIAGTGNTTIAWCADW